MNDIVWTVIGLIAASLTSFGFVPQVRKMWRRRSVGDVSHITMYQFMTGNALWLVYGIGRYDFIIIGANVIAISIVIVGLVLYYRFREQRAGGVIKSTLLGAQELGTDPLATVREVSHGLLKTAAETGHDIGAIARAAVEEAREGAKAPVVDVRSEAAASAAATGAVEAAAEMGKDKVREVRKAISESLEKSANEEDGGDDF
jgi:MtN3 and saliva related transmembrane protein